MMAMYAKIEQLSPSTGTAVKSVFLTASNDASPTPPERPGYTYIGSWDVDKGGSMGTDGSRGAYMMGMYINREQVGGGFVSDIQLTASNNDHPTAVPGHRLVGYWDVDKGGSVGTDGSRGSYMMGLFVE